MSDAGTAAGSALEGPAPAVGARPDAGDEVHLLIGALPPPLRGAVSPHADALVEIVLDLGRIPEARLTDRTVPLAAASVSADDLAHVVEQIGAFGDDNRAGIPRTLHRISALRNRGGDVVGLTLRVGRAVFGTIDLIRDLVEGGGNLLLLGQPGIGKTTKLREVARVLADDLGKRVMVIDTSNEIAGDGDVPHPGIGRARRMQVPRVDRQHDVMIEAVENHMPEAVVVDEIGRASEAAAARTIAERGVQLVGTAHGNSLENLILNPTLSDLVGGVQTVTLGDEEARRRGTQKTVTERRAPPTFDIVVELVGRDEVVVHRDTAQAVDRLLAGGAPGGERRIVDGGEIRVDAVEAPPPPPKAAGPPQVPRIFAPGVDRDLLRRVAADLALDIRVVDRLERADLVLLLRSRGGLSRLRREADRRGLPVQGVKRVSSSALRRALRHALRALSGEDDDEQALDDAERAVRQVLSDGAPVHLRPRPPRLRAAQHRLVSRYHLFSRSVGAEGRRHLVVSTGDSEE